MDIVPNEWLLDYLNPASDPRKRRFVVDFLNSLWKNGHRIVIGRSTKFGSKFYRFMKEFGYCPGTKAALSMLSKAFYDSEKTMLIESPERLCGEISKKAPEDDEYLLELGFSSNDKLIVTTDRRLKERCNGVDGIQILLIGELINELKLDLVAPE